jgi:hypothetical protein
VRAAQRRQGETRADEGEEHVPLLMRIVPMVTSTMRPKKSSTGTPKSPNHSLRTRSEKDTLGLRASSLPAPAGARL